MGTRICVCNTLSLQGAPRAGFCGWSPGPRLTLLTHVARAFCAHSKVLLRLWKRQEVAGPQVWTFVLLQFCCLGLPASPSCLLLWHPSAPFAYTVVSSPIFHPFLLWAAIICPGLSSFSGSTSLSRSFPWLLGSPSLSIPPTPSLGLHPPPSHALLSQQPLPGERNPRPQRSCLEGKAWLCRSLLRGAMGVWTGREE